MIRLGAHNYLSANNVFPKGIQFQANLNRRSSVTRKLADFGVAVLRAKQRFNAINFSVSMYTAQNTTVSGIGLSILWCPSDPVISGLTFTYPAGSVCSTVLPMYYAPQLCPCI